MKKMTKIIIVSVLGLAAAITVSGYFIKKAGSKPNFEFITLEKTALKQIISATGKTEPASKVELSFEKAGKVAQVLVEIGDTVFPGQALVQLDSSELKAQLAQYQANLQVEQANLAELEKGSTTEEIQLAKTKTDNAQKAVVSAQSNLEAVQNKAEVDLANVYDDVEDTLQSAYSEADDAVNKQIDDLFSNDNSQNPQLTFSTSDLAQEILVEGQRVAAGETINSFKTMLDNLTSAYDNLDNGLVEGENYLNSVRDFLNQLNQVLNVAAGVSESAVNTYKGYVNTARDNLNTALSEVNNQKQTIAGQKADNQKNIAASGASLTTTQNNLKVAQDELSLKLAGPTEEQIQAKQAKVEVTQANIRLTQVQIAKMTLLSPINGVVSKQQAKKGEIVSAQSPVVSVISQGDFEVNVNIPEVDIAKIALGNPAEITLDAYGDELVFQAQISAIEPAETIIEGVATFKTTLQFSTPDSRLKSGMTCNIEILAQSKANVLAVPYRSIIQKNGDKFVQVLTGSGAIEEVSVQTGLRGSDGNVEIISGLQEGDKVITYIEE